VSQGPVVRVLASLDEIARAAAEEFVAVVSRATREAPCRVLLSGGTTPEPFYRLLASEPTRSRVDWQALECYFGDERPVAPDHPSSNFGMVKRALFEPLGLAAPRAYRIRGEASDLELAAVRYEALVRNRFSAYSPAVPSFDLAFLGLGPDGHTASIFPGVELPADRLFASVWAESLGSRRVTATYLLLNATRRAIFLVSGSDKAAAVRRSLSPERGEEPTPASRVATRGETIWLLDRGAAAAVPKAALR
jgi:6-phosphogluconolactonase